MLLWRLRINFECKISNSIVKTSFLKLSRISQLSRLTWEPCRDKSRPPCLKIYTLISISISFSFSCWTKWKRAPTGSCTAQWSARRRRSLPSNVWRWRKRKTDSPSPPCAKSTPSSSRNTPTSSPSEKSSSAQTWTEYTSVKRFNEISKIKFHLITNW